MHLSEYKQHLDNQTCPKCGKTECWDLDNNEHIGDQDTLIYSCECGAIWTEVWKLESVSVLNTDFFKYSL